MANRPQQLRRVPATGPMAMLAGEAVQRLATPEIASHLIADALTAAGLAVVPEDRPGFASFACGALKIVIREALGDEAAEAVMQDLEPAFVKRTGQASSGVQKRGRESLTRPAAHDRVVLIASHDRALVERLQPSFGEHTKVVAAYDVYGLLQSSQRYLESPLVLLLHDDMPSIRPSSLATLARVMPPSTTIVQFGTRKTEPDRRSEVPPLRWIRLGDVPAHAILEACVELVPTPGARAKVIHQIVLAHGDALIRTEIAARLRHDGHQVLETATGFEALDRCIDELPTLIVASRGVPALNGEQLAALIATRFAEKAPQVVLLDIRPGDAPLKPGVSATVDEADVEGLVKLLRGE